MRSTFNDVITDNFKRSLVTLRPGKYPIVGSDKSFDVETPTHALTVEHVGIHVDQTSCWHVLVNNSVLLVWDCDMVER
jgi:hypothetical protein